MMSHIIEVDCRGRLVEEFDALHSYLGKLLLVVAGMLGIVGAAFE